MVHAGPAPGVLAYCSELCDWIHPSHISQKVTSAKPWGKEGESDVQAVLQLLEKSLRYAQNPKKIISHQKGQ